MRRPLNDRALRALVLAVACAATVFPAPLGAHIVSDREVQILKGLPDGLVPKLVARPDSSGYVRPNRGGGWDHVDHQTEALVLLMDACARSDSVTAENAWQAIEVAFVHQQPAGDYETPVFESPEQRLTRTAWWIAQLCRAEVVVTNSPLQKRFRWRLNLMLPKLRRSVDWFVGSGEEVLRLHDSRPELLMIDAQAFLLADGIYHEPRFAELGQRALTAGLRGQRKDGAFVTGSQEIGGHGRAMVALLEIATYFPMPSLDEATNRGAQWLLRHFLKAPGKGQGVGPARGRNLDALMALAYEASRSRDRGLGRTVEELAGRLGMNARP